MPRLLDNWLSFYSEYTQYDEAAEQFHWWTGLVLLAIAVNRSVWMSRGYYRTYPNLYVLFVGPSGVGKSTASGIGMGLLLDAGLNVSIFSDSITSAALLQFMSESRVIEQREYVIVDKTPVLIYASELGNLLNKRTGVRELTLVLTELFNKQGDHHDTTLKRDKIVVVKPNVSALLCCFPQFIYEELPSSSLRSGFLGRMFVIYTHEKRSLRPEIQMDDFDSNLRRLLIDDLKHIASLYGEMTFDEKGREYWHEWYNTLPTNFAQFESDVEGFHSRQAAFVQRIAMLYSLSERDDLVITRPHIEAAIASVKACEQNLSVLAHTEPSYDHLTRIVRLLEKHGEVHKSRIANWTSKYMNAASRQEALDTLYEGKIIDYLSSGVDMKVRLRDGWRERV